MASAVDYPTIATYFGAGALLVSIPIISGKNKKMRQGIEKMCIRDSTETWSLSI